MPARPPIFTKNGFYHIYNRGHNKQPIFLDTKDYQRYIRRLREYLPKHPITLLAYCLMPNHLHLLIKQDAEEVANKFIHRLHTAYTMYFNKKYERVGSVFQGRFKAKLIETDEYLLHVSRYIHLNPFEILHTQGPALNSLIDYPWSSLKEYAVQRNHLESPLCETHYILDYFSTQRKSPSQNYLQFVEEYLPVLTQHRLEEIRDGNF